MIGDCAKQEEIRNAIAEAKGYFEALEQLLERIQEGGVPISESPEKIGEAKKLCKEAMERFVSVYRANRNG